jgi:hypothetical protein
MFDALVTFMTLISIAFVVVWWRCASIRNCMEAPKYRFLRQARAQDERRDGTTGF